MTKYRKKPIEIEATQWFKSGDHPLDDRETFCVDGGEPFLGEGKIVRYFRRPDIPGETVCSHCKKTMHEHGWIDTLEGGHRVCLGDWIITGIAGEMYPCKPDIFEATYDRAVGQAMVKYVPLVANDDGWSDWVNPTAKGYRLGCCDCGLVHDMDFCIEDGRVLFRSSRNNRSTGQVRRWMKVLDGLPAQTGP